MFRCGEFVRHISKDFGTGQVVAVAMLETLRPDNTTLINVAFDIRWLDRGGQVSRHGGSELAASSRAVPRFASVAEAEAWMEQQEMGGGWVGSAEDLNATMADTLDRAATQVVTEAERALTVLCGDATCGCQDCVSVSMDETTMLHVGSCDCAARGCGCATT